MPSVMPNNMFERTPRGHEEQGEVRPVEHRADPKPERTFKRISTPKSLIKVNDFDKTNYVGISDIIGMVLSHYDVEGVDVEHWTDEKAQTAMCKVTIRANGATFSGAHGEPWIIKKTGDVDTDAPGKAESYAYKRAARWMGIGCDIPISPPKYTQGGR